MNSENLQSLVSFSPLPENVLSALRESSLFIFLDYDGTLTPIINDPPKAEIQPEEREVIRKLSECPNVRVAIVSGRSLADVKKKVGLDSLIYIGNHGLEYEGPYMEHVHPIAVAEKEKMKLIHAELTKQFKGMQGVWVEDKMLTLSIHYRMLDEAKVNQAREIVYAVISPYLRSRELLIRQGKKVWEIRPMVDWDKGKMVIWTLARFMARFPKKILPIYFGDDDTDEDAFRSLKSNGITVRVTDNPQDPSSAKYFLKSPAEVYESLQKIKDLRNNGK